jgi:hypothetical protein
MPLINDPPPRRLTGFRSLLLTRYPRSFDRVPSPALACF